jgi:hypothetical protein
MDFNPINSIKKLFGLGQYPLVSIKSKVDNKEYLVRDMPDKQEAADLMASIRIKMSNLKVHLESKYPDKPQVKQLIINFEANPNRFYESTPESDLTSYSVNKGESVHLCLRQREDTNESLVDENVIMFVSLHEMSHMITKTIGHGQDFWNNFAWILKEAETIGIYKSYDFKAQPVKYCGMSITDQPTYNPSLEEGFKNSYRTSKDGTDLSIGSIG